MNNRPTSYIYGQDQFWFWFSAITLYVWLLANHGFIAHSNDTIETVPYALWLHDSNFFSQDFHIQALSSIFPNERIGIARLLHFFPNSIWTASIVLHFIFSVSLILGLLRIVSLFTKSHLAMLLVVIATLGTSYMINLGGNELYYNMFVSSLAGKSIAVWGVYYFLKNNYWLSSLLLGIASFWHPLVGVHLFVALSWVFLFGQKNNRSDYLKWVLPFLLTGGIWIGVILLGHQESIVSEYVFSDIIYSRIGHHFYPELFGLKNYIVLLPLFVFATWYFYHHDKRIFHFFVASLVGIIVYIVGISINIDTILSTQWFKVTIWLKFLSIIALVLFFKSIFTKKVYLILAIITAVVLTNIRFQPSFDQSSDKQLYSYIIENTSTEDVFLLPYDLTDFKSKTKRSSYFDYKAMLHHKPFIYDWADRLKEVYGINIQYKEYINGNMLHSKYLSNPKILSSQRIDYIIVPNESKVEIDWELVLKTDKHKLYKK